MMPTSRNRSVTSQITGKRINASRARGQQSTNRMHHPTNRIRVFTPLSFHHPAPRQRHVVTTLFWFGNSAVPLRDAAGQVGRRLERLRRIVDGG